MPSITLRNIALAGLLAASPALALSPKYDLRSGPLERQTPRHSSVAQTENRVHNVGKLWMNVTNWGYLGNLNTTGSFMTDPCTGDWAPQLEYPGGSGVQYLWQTGVWVGATIREESFEYPRVSEGVSPVDFTTEMYPGPEPGHGIMERSTRSSAFNCLGEFISSDDAVSEQDFVAEYTDTARVRPGGAAISNGYDGPHVPLGIKVTQHSYSWSYNYARDFIIVDYAIENIADKFLKNVFVGLYVDGDVGHVSEISRFADDLCGFIKTYEYTPEGAEEPIPLTINAAWVADNDGRRDGVSTGPLVAPDVTGARVVRAPNPRLRTSFNWWITGSGLENEYGPAWEDDEAAGSWTSRRGLPQSDADRYFVLSNREFDFDQVKVDDPDWLEDNPQQFVNRFTGEVVEEHEWEEPTIPYPANVASGVDTRYLLSWGPLGVLDYIDENGNRVYRLNPGERFSMTVAFIGGEDFHQANNPQPSAEQIDESLFDYLGFQVNADWAAKVYDNPMLDSDGDSWFGEDTGIDGLYGETAGDSVSFQSNTGEFFQAIYPGPDEGELDSRLQPEEDTAPRPLAYDYTAYNQLFDQGDGVPDFRGPPPPPAPVIGHRIENDHLLLTWSPDPSELPTGADPFSHLIDFEGYRIYVSNSGAENEFSLLAEFDLVNYAYYSPTDSLMSVPIRTTRPDTLPSSWRPPGPSSVIGTLKPVGVNVGLGEIRQSDSSYVFDVGKARPMMPRYYAITAYDFGDPTAGVAPLESSRSASRVYLAPSGEATRKPGVVPNPYRADADYTQQHLRITFNNQDTSFVSWENRNDGTEEFYPQTDRRIYFYNLPRKAIVRIYTVAGDMVQMIRHDADRRIGSLGTWQAEHAVSWDLNSRNRQQVVSGIYLFSVEDSTPEGRGEISVGKFVIIR